MQSHKFITATPHDMRIPGRLSQLYQSQGQIQLARSILQEALQTIISIKQLVIRSTIEWYLFV